MTITRAVDLCAGTGAFSLALKKYNINTVYSNDMEPASQVIYNSNLEGANYELANIHDIDITTIPSFFRALICKRL